MLDWGPETALDHGGVYTEEMEWQEFPYCAQAIRDVNYPDLELWSAAAICEADVVAVGVGFASKENALAWAKAQCESHASKEAEI